MMKIDYPFCLSMAKRLSQQDNIAGLCNTLCRIITNKLPESAVFILRYSDMTGWKQIASFTFDEYQLNLDGFEIDHDIACLYKQHLETQEIVFDNEQGRHFCLSLKGKYAETIMVLVSSSYHIDYSSEALTLFRTLLSAIFKGVICDQHYLIEKENHKNTSQKWGLEISTQKGLLEQLHKLHQISLRLWQTQSLSNMLHTAVYECIQSLDLDRMGIFLCNKESGLMRGTYGTDINGKVTNESWYCTSIKDHIQANQTLEKGQHVTIEPHCPLYHNSETVGYGWNATISLWDGDNIIGWIACDNLISGTPIKNYHHELFKLLGVTISQHLIQRQGQDELKALNISLENRINERTRQLQKANEKLQQISREDSLTQVHNRRMFDEKFDEEWRRAQRHQYPVSLLIVDIDHFKQYNDHYGHIRGDQCLQNIAQTLNKIDRRAGSLFARYGGEEFVFLLPNYNNKTAKIIADKAINAVLSLKIPHETSPITPLVTISIGGCTLIPEKHCSPSLLFKHSDDALYKAKNAGKNQALIENEICR